MEIFNQNKRTICAINTKEFDKIIMIEVGATNVGSINQTYQVNKKVNKGDEKGYFQLGASTVIILFKQNRIVLNQDITDAARQQLEIKGLMGQPLGRKG